MSLIPYTITALEANAVDSATSGKNIVVSAVVTMTDSAGVVTMYDDAAGSNGSTAKVTGADGQVTVFVNPNTYTISVNGSVSDIEIAEAKFTGTTSELISGDDIYSADTVINTTGFTTSGSGSGSWVQTGVTGQTTSQSPAQLVDALLTDGLGNQWKLVNSGEIKISALGGLIGSNNGAVVFAFNASSANTLDLEGLTWPARDINCDNAADKSKIQKSFTNGTLIVVNSLSSDVDLQTIQPFAQDEIAVSGKKSQVLTWKDKSVLWLGTSIPHQGAGSDGYPELLSSTLDFTVANWAWSGSHAFYDIAGDAFASNTIRALSMTEADRLAGLALHGSSSAYDDSFNNVTIASQMTTEYRIKNQFIASAYDVVVLDHNHNDRKSVQTYTANDKTLTAVTKGATTVVAVNNTTGLTVGDGAYLQVTGIASLQYAAARITAISGLDVTLAIDSSGYAGTYSAGTLHWVDRNTLEGSFDFLIAYTKNMGIIYGNTDVDIVLCNAPSYFTNNTNRDFSIWNSGKTIKAISDKWSLGYFDVAATLDLIYEQHLIYFPDAVHPSTLETRKALASYWAEWMSGGKQTVVNHAESLAKNKLVIDEHQEFALFSKYDDAYAYRANLFSDDTPIINEDFSGGIGTWTVTSTAPVIEAAPWGVGDAAKFIVTTGAPQPYINKPSALGFDPVLEFDLYFPTINLATGTSNQLAVFSLLTADSTTYSVTIVQSLGGDAALRVTRSDGDVLAVNMSTFTISAATKYTIKTDIIKGDTTGSDGYILITINGVKLYAGDFANGGVASITDTRLGAVFNNMGSDFNFYISNIVTGAKTRSASFGWPEIQKTTISYRTFAELQALTETVDYKQFTVAERANAAYTLQPTGYAALAGDATLANGRVAQLQTNGYKNARFYGATGNGTTDDTTAMQAAISSLVQFESLHIPSGTYKISSTLTLSAWRTSIYGDGMSTRLRRSADGIDILHVTPANPASDVVSYFSLSNMELSGEGITNNTSGSGLRLTQVFRSLISNLHVNGNYGGILLEGCNSIHFNSLEIYADQNFNNEFKADSYLMKFVKQQLTSGVQLPSGIFIESLQARGSIGNGYLDKGIVIQAADNLWFNNTHIGILAGDAVYVNPQDANDSMFGINFKATHFDGGAASGSIMQNCVNYDIGASVPVSKIKGHSYVGCQFSNILNDGFKCNATEQLTVSDVVISDGRFNNIGGWGINIDDGLRYVISDSTFYDMTNSSGCIKIKDADFVKVDAIFGESPIGIQTTGNATRLMVEGIWQNVTDDVIISTGNSSKQIEGLSNSSFSTVASSSDISLRFPYDTFNITGVVTIDTINANSIADGRVVTLVFGGACAVANSAILLSSAFTSTTNSTLTLKYHSGSWIEISRSIR